jgi:hypothetical protein
VEYFPGKPLDRFGICDLKWKHPKPKDNLIDAKLLELTDTGNDR